MSTVDWLIENGGPVVRYRTACELLNDAGLAESLSEELLRFDVVQQWLSYLPSDISDRRPRGKGVHSIFGMGVHGGGNDKLETILGVLLNLGLHAGLAELDEKIEPYMRWLEEAVERSQEHPFSSFPISIIASRLASLGYKSRAIDTARAMRLSAILEFVRMGSFDIYVEWGGRHKRPEHSKNRQLINPELYKDGRFRLPWHHDIYLFGVEPDETKQLSLFE